MARQYRCFAIAIVLDLPEELCHQPNQLRSDVYGGKLRQWNGSMIIFTASLLSRLRIHSEANSSSLLK